MTPEEKVTAMKNIVKPSVRPQDATVATPDTAKLAPPNDYISYLKNACDGKDKYEFDDHKEAYEFGWALRERHGDKIKVQTTEKTVRVFLV